MNPEGKIGPSGLLDSMANQLRKITARSVAVHGADDSRSGRHLQHSRLDESWLFRIGLAADAGVTRMLGGMHGGIAQGVNRAFREHEPVIIRLRVRKPQALFAALGKAGEVPVLQFVPAKPLLIEVGEDRVAARVNPYPAREPLGAEKVRRQPPFPLKVGMAPRILHAPVFSFDLHPVLGGFFQRGKPGQGSGSPADPWPQLLADLAQAQARALLHESEDRAVIPVVPDREIDVVAVTIELDNHLVAAVPHDSGPAPAFALVEGIALFRRVLAQVDFALEVFQLAIPRHDVSPCGPASTIIVNARLRKTSPCSEPLAPPSTDRKS